MVGLAQLVRVPDCDSGGRGFDSHSSPHIYIGVSPSGKASDFDSDIRRFKSCYPCQFDSLAQSVEHVTFNHGVPRSSRGWVTI